MSRNGGRVSFAPLSSVVDTTSSPRRTLARSPCTHSQLIAGRLASRYTSSTLRRWAEAVCSDAPRANVNANGMARTASVSHIGAPPQRFQVGRRHRPPEQLRHGPVELPDVLANRCRLHHQLAGLELAED